MKDWQQIARKQIKFLVATLSERNRNLECTRFTPLNGVTVSFLINASVTHQLEPPLLLV